MAFVATVVKPKALNNSMSSSYINSLFPSFSQAGLFSQFLEKDVFSSRALQWFPAFNT